MPRHAGAGPIRPTHRPALRLGALGLVLVLLPLGCSTSPRLRELPVPPQRVGQSGYWFLPPAEPGWMEALRNPSRLMLGKFGANPDETFAIQALVAPAPDKNGTAELLAFARAEQQRDIDPNRHRVLTHEVAAATHRGAECVQSRIASEDNAPRKRSARPGPMMIDALSLACRHPTNTAVLINITYSHRFYPEHRDPQLPEKAARVFRTLELVDF